jgi:hypothetical protein
VFATVGSLLLALALELALAITLALGAEVALCRILRFGGWTVFKTFAGTVIKLQSGLRAVVA